MDTPSDNRRGVHAELWSAAWRFRRRTLAALLLLLLAKVAGVGVPLLLKAVVDLFSRPESLTEAIPAVVVGGEEPSLALVLPVFLLLAYALLRFAGTLFTELRDLVFAPRHTAHGDRVLAANLRAPAVAHAALPQPAQHRCADPRRGARHQRRRLPARRRPVHRGADAGRVRAPCWR